MKKRLVSTGNYIKIVVVFVAAIVLSVCDCRAVGNEYNTELEAAYGETFKSVYNEKVEGSPLEAEVSDGVDTATGHLILLRTDLFLPGTGGMDFELKRYYNSNEAGIGNPTVEGIAELKVDTVDINYSTQDGETHQIPVNEKLLTIPVGRYTE